MTFILKDWVTKKLKELIEGQEVVLTQDYSNDDRDKYGRMLRYVARMDGLLVNEEMIKEGYAYAYIKFPFERREAYLKLQTEARTMGRGLWATTTCSGRIHIEPQYLVFMNSVVWIRSGRFPRITVSFR